MGAKAGWAGGWQRLACLGDRAQEGVRNRLLARVLDSLLFSRDLALLRSGAGVRSGPGVEQCVRALCEALRACGASAWYVRAVCACAACVWCGACVRVLRARARSVRAGGEGAPVRSSSRASHGAPASASAGTRCQRCRIEKEVRHRRVSTIPSNAEKKSMRRRGGVCGRAAQQSAGQGGGGQIAAAPARS
eukprot:6172242-Pleurochrysis_carterae.AAC.2